MTGRSIAQAAGTDFAPAVGGATGQPGHCMRAMVGRHDSETIGAPVGSQLILAVGHLGTPYRQAVRSDAAAKRLSTTASLSGVARRPSPGCG